MSIQLELFPDYPRLAPPPPPPSKWAWLEEAWATLYYPEEDDNDYDNMGQNTLQGKLITYMKGVLDACLDYVQHGFVAADLFMNRTALIQGKGASPHAQVRSLAPDIIFVNEVVPMPVRGSFNVEKEEKKLREAWYEKHGTEMPNEEFAMQILVVEVLSPSNYIDKADQLKRYNFYNAEGVREYLVVHTKDDKLSLEFYTNIQGTLMRVLDFPTHTSALAKVTFEIENNELIMRTLSGDKFLYYENERKMRLKTQNALEKAREAHEETQQQLAKAQREAERFAKERDEEAKALQEAEAQMAKERAEEAKTKEDYEALKMQFLELQRVLEWQKQNPL